MAEAVEAPGETALLIIDMINALDFEDAAPMQEPAEAAGEAILTLRAAADAAGVPVIYVNDNGGEWHSERSRLVEKVTDSDAPGRELTRRLAPRRDDYFIIKPQFSGFYSTNLPVLLPKLGVSRLILTGVAADICVLFTAADAHMRTYKLWVPEDAVASSDPLRTKWALEIMRNSMEANIAPTTECSLADWIAGAE
ncbi:cysteine hydrolase [Sphingomonas sp. PL-96]|uniref:isochorismatase family cysteine hydrolase n=1 Tax=Sphingomonas sp. PL-96 TaxID=2887201 RepID=UPI001E31D4C5|nr:isochorismatase family cysteine hydrolase [Sphingomonas sp. PL-96]MCC2976908.1 cysteine hydrolase [Sphingomonas sp. PL-96]